MLVEQFSYYEDFTDLTNGCMQNAVHEKKEFCLNSHFPQELDGVPHDRGTECWKFIFTYFEPTRIEYSKISKKLRKTQRRIQNPGHRLFLTN